jgi:hypothetical protein
MIAAFVDKSNTQTSRPINQGGPGEIRTKD